MERILIIGSGGAGKSTLSFALARATGLPLIHLDREFWLPGWVERDRADWQAVIAAIIAQPRWIVEGNYGATLPMRLARADTVIFLDFPAWLCLWRVMGRSLRKRDRVRPDMAPGCADRVDLAFWRYIIGFPRKGRLRILAALEGYCGSVIRLSNAKEVRAFIEQAGASGVQPLSARLS